MFKPGDKIRFTSNEYDTTNFTIGKVYIVAKKQCLPDDKNHVCVEADDSGGHNGWMVKLFKLAEAKSLTEVEWLDRVKENFQE